MSNDPASLKTEALRTVYQCPRCDTEQETDQEPERCPVCNFHGLPDGRWIMKLAS